MQRGDAQREMLRARAAAVHAAAQGEVVDAAAPTGGGGSRCGLGGLGGRAIVRGRRVLAVARRRRLRAARLRLRISMTRLAKWRRAIRPRNADWNLPAARSCAIASVARRHAERARLLERGDRLLVALPERDEPLEEAFDLGALLGLARRLARGGRGAASSSSRAFFTKSFHVTSPALSLPLHMRRRMPVSTSFILARCHERLIFQNAPPSPVLRCHFWTICFVLDSTSLRRSASSCSMSRSAAVCSRQSLRYPITFAAIQRCTSFVTDLRLRASSVRQIHTVQPLRRPWLFITTTHRCVMRSSSATWRAISRVTVRHLKKPRQ